MMNLADDDLLATILIKEPYTRWFDRNDNILIDISEF